MKLNHPELVLLHELKRMPRLIRIIHPKTLWHFRRLLLGIGLMLFGAALAVNHHSLAENCPHYLWDGFAYFVHGFGFTAIAKNIDVFWDFICA